MRISPGVLSRLVRLEELHMMRVKDCSYSTLRELESLSRLTALTLDGCSKDVIYSTLGLSSKLTQYALDVNRCYTITSFMKTYNKAINLDITEGTPLGDWIRLLLRNSEVVHSRGKGSKNVVVELQNVKDLRLAFCDHLRHLFCASLACPDDEEEGIPRRTHIRPDVIKFPNLHSLTLDDLGCFTHFCSDTVEGIQFSLLREMHLKELREFQNFWPRANNAITNSNPLFNEKVSCSHLQVLELNEANSITALCSHQLPTAYFSKLETLQVSCPYLEVVKLYEANSITALCCHELPTASFSKLEALEVENCGKLRNLMSPSVARGLLNLRMLYIGYCQSIEEVITEEEQQGDEIMCNEPLFRRLEKLKLHNLLKLGHFILTKHALKFPFLKEVDIRVCLKMKAFIQQGSVSTPSLESVNSDDELKVVDLNKTMFNSKVSCPNLEVLELNEANSITALCSHQLPTAYFSKLETLEVNNCGKLRNLMSPSVARGLLNLRILWIQDCQSMEVIA